ncbi:hypothetical protein GQ607_007315, partial [Colletotrichum asianum]
MFFVPWLLPRRHCSRAGPKGTSICKTTHARHGEEDAVRVCSKSRRRRV